MLETPSLAQQLRALPHERGYRYSEDVARELLRKLFYSLANNNEQYVNLFFPRGAPQPGIPWKLSEARGAVDGAEYTEAARGKRCGHIFKHEEATYFCRTCTTDVTCVLCQKCFDASDHDGHHVEMHLSEGSSGCCDCGDEEAWSRPLKCGIHTPLQEMQGSRPDETRHNQSTLPPELQESIRRTIGRVFDYMCDVFSCAPEHMQLPRHEHSIFRDEELARLAADQYAHPSDTDRCSEYALILWNDEKHTVDEVQEQVARATKRPKSYGYEKAREIDAVGRAVVMWSDDVSDLLRRAKILGQIKVTVTIRSARDYFREMMCDTLVEWLADISACSVGDDHNILMDTVCSEMLKQWNIGSLASNMQIGRQGFTDHQKTENRLQEMRERDLQNRLLAAREQVRQAGVDVRAVLPTFARPRRGAVTGTETTDDDQNDDDDNEDDENPDDDDETGVNDFTIEALLQDMEENGEVDPGGVVINAPQNAIVMDTGELLATAPAQPDNRRSASAEPRSPSSDSDADASMLSPQNDPDDLISRSALSQTSAGTETTPKHWLRPGKRINEQNARQDVPVEENFNKRVRIDFLILYDLRMWKVLRNNLRRLYIGTVIKVPHFKRVLGLRFAAIYRTLAQLYLVADREPDHSIINLSLQMLTTPSITAEVIDRGNFCTRLLAILYTFLTKRRVGNPEDVDLTVGMNIEAGVITNRRIHHFFSDLKYMLEAKYTHQRLREDPDYLLQFLDILKLFQGMDPNVRAIGEHVPFETDAWMTTIMLIRDLARNIRSFAESFRWLKPGPGVEPMYSDPLPMCRAIKEIAKSAILHSMGIEHNRFFRSEIQHPLGFKAVEPTEFEVNTSNYNASTQPVVDFVVERERMSFHHPLHWAFSWVVDEGKSMAKAQLQSQLKFTYDSLQTKFFSFDQDAELPRLEPLQYLLALFDVPLRTLVWISQLRAGMWVRNGLGLRHQLSTFRQVTQREITSQRDIFLVQTAFVVCPSDTFLANVVDRFHMRKLITGDTEVPQDWQDHHLMDVAEDFVHFLIVILSDRTLLRPADEDPNPTLTQAVREIAHTLCFKPLPYSDLTDRITHGTTSMPAFNQVVASVANYKPPEGLQDSGTFELKPERFDDIDPFNYYYSKNQREEAENAWKRNEAKRKGMPVDDVVFEPHLKPIRTGLFTDLPAFSQTPLFGQIIWGMLNLALNPTSIGDLPASRVEAFLPLVLYLILIAIAEDKSAGIESQPSKSFSDAVLHTTVGSKGANATTSSTILHQLFKLKDNPDLHDTSKPRLRRVIQRLREKRPYAFDQVARQEGLAIDDPQAEPSKEQAAQEQAEKKRKAQERNARVMASFKKQQSDFMSSQMADADLEEWDDIGNDVEMQDAGARPTWDFPRDTCIFCQEETDDQRLYGSLAYITKSKTFRDTDLTDSDHLHEVAITPLSYDRNTEGLRPFGMARSNVEKVKRVNENNEAVIHERRTLGKGWTPDHNSAGNVATSCGHLMHFSCFETFNAAAQRRQQYQIARNHPERVSQNEFCCPLCKALGNTFLPIIFKSKELQDPSSLSSEGFDDWLLSRTPYLASESRAQNDETYLQEAKAYRDHSIQQSYSSLLNPEPTVASSRPHLAMPSFLGGASVASTRDQLNPQNAEPTAAYKRLKETIVSNKLDPQQSGNARTSAEYSPADVVAGCLGSSIAAAEIALRGQESALDSVLYLDKVSQQSITHLRVLSETCSTATAYVAMGGAIAAKASVNNQRAQLLGGITTSDQASLSPSIRRVPALLSEDTFEFLTRSSVFLAPYLSLADRMQHLIRLCLLAEIVKVVLAHLQGYESISVYANHDKPADTPKTSCSPEQSQSFSAFVQSIIDKLKESPELPNTAGEWVDDVESNPNERGHFDTFVRSSVLSYALPFLRKCLLLMHIRACVDFGAAVNLDPDAPEIDRLTTVLGLPSIDNLIQSTISTDRVAVKLQDLIRFWISHWQSPRAGPEPSKLSRHFGSIIDDANTSRSVFSPNALGDFANTNLFMPSPPGAFVQDNEGPMGFDPFTQEDSSSSTPRGTPPPSTTYRPPPLRLPHPGIYELVALPSTHDTLLAVALSRHCPTTGGPIQDPYLCLFCGAIFCGQASCCAKDVGSGNTHGGCYQHQLKCGGTVGMFFNIRRNAVAFLNGRNGSFFPAPYLDEHGEVDFGLKRRGRLWLEGRRYERLFREVWLKGEVPSVVCRKLDGEVNVGGWETL